MELIAKPGQRIPELDGIRGLAIAMVLTWHYFTVPLSKSSSPFLLFLSPVTLQSWSGVDLFFVLSGFLIGGILIDAKSSEHCFRTFYVRRAFRILPIYVVACFAYFPVSRWAVYGFQGATKAAMPWYVYATFTQNFWLAPTWSLAIEEQFYLTLPLLIWIVPEKHLWKVVAAGVIAVLEFRSIAYLHFYPHWSEVALYVLSPFRADGLLMGVLAAILVRNPARLACIRERRRPLIVAGAALDLFPLAIALAVSLLLAHLSWTLFESPLVKYGHRFAYGKK